jgi:hypothetical protein
MYNNIFMEPFFIDPFLMNFNLQEISPCIDAGDPSLPLDPDDTVTDIGALYFDQSLGIENQPHSSPSQYNLQQAFPNPFNPTTTIGYTLQTSGQVDLVVYDLSGRQVASLVNGWRTAGDHEVTFDATGLAAGMYVYRINAAEFSASGKMVLLK